MIVKPSKPGLVIRDPKTRRPLPDEGARVPDSSFWRRRLIAGDVVELTDAEVKAIAAAKEKAREEAKRAAAKVPQAKTDTPEVKASSKGKDK